MNKGFNVVEMFIDIEEILKPLLFPESESSSHGGSVYVVHIAWLVLY